MAPHGRQMTTTPLSMPPADPPRLSSGPEHERRSPGWFRAAVRRTVHFSVRAIADGCSSRQRRTIGCCFRWWCPDRRPQSDSYGPRSPTCWRPPTCRWRFQALQTTAPVAADATPVFSQPVAQDGALRVGDRAAGGDPLAGDGVGRAVRSAVLAAAVVLDAGRGRAPAYDHYASRIAAAHAAHLSATASFYAVSNCANAFAPAINTMQEHARLLENDARRLGQPIKIVARSDAVQLVRTAYNRP